ncbi:PBSX family phage terminase large subunit [Brevibacillus ruminantium]|uniref:PBSX family phage terminase large subunit n=1 Tax=Brevibacillus ruminantium TaxID=2950604 RepID=A0ABY4WDD3_9BACL|nr:PBSX family phage terminase large subunit [Brevibacillus ruminantium]USG65175.1 PBSX family phage terminase large subunit [Brevibacillus ruminantium]
MRKKNQESFKWRPFSKKQLKVLTWWRPDSPVKDRDAIICDGSVRAGKTIVMSFSFVAWAMDTFSGENLGMAGKTIGALRRNVLQPLKRILKGRGYKVKDHRADNYLTITYKGKTNYFYLFGGKDESSQDLIQGITLAGMFFDEVALMPKSFVDQATARCSVEGAKYWFNCNPAGPYHWFKLEWLDKLEEKNAVHIHFTMDDNLSLSPKTKERYKRMYSGVFYKRFILGLWVLAQGIIYDMWDDDENTFDDDDLPQGFKYRARRHIAVDYGTQNAMVFLDIWDDGDTCWILNEYYYDGRDKGIQKEDSQYADDFEEFVGTEFLPAFTIIDPSAASFKAALRNRGYRIKDADNDVEDGIRMTQTMILKRKIRVHKHNCPNFLKERASYIWDEKASGKGIEKPIKQNDHCMDGTRYFVKTVITPRRLASAS